MVYGGAPASNTNDALKLLVGDTSTAASGELLSTGECAYFISNYGGVRAAAPYAARAIAAGFADQGDKNVGDLRLAAQQKFEHYDRLASRLEGGAAVIAVPYAGGVSRSDKLSVEQNTDRVSPAFKIGLHDNPQTGSTST